MSAVKNVDNGNQLVLTYLITSVAFFLIAALLGVFGRLAIAEPSLMSPQLFYQIITAHPLVMATGWGTLLLMGICIFLIPLLTGRPLYSWRLARITYWCMTVGALLILLGGSTARYTALPPLQHTLGTVLGLVVCLVGVVLYCVNVVKSIVGAPGGERHPSLYYFAAGAILGLVYLTIAGVTQAIPTIFSTFGHPVRCHPLAGWKGNLQQERRRLGARLLSRRQRRRLPAPHAHGPHPVVAEGGR
jgi:heme/copper-type cytochrome/quinol oxidase subunit 1